MLGEGRGTLQVLDVDVCESGNCEGSGDFADVGLDSVWVGLFWIVLDCFVSSFFDNSSFWRYEHVHSSSWRYEHVHLNHTESTLAYVPQRTICGSFLRP